MKWRTGKVPNYTLIGLALFALLLFALEDRTRLSSEQPYYEEKLRAARLADKAFAAVKELREELGIPLDRLNDPSLTGLIGHQFSLITLGEAELREKLTSVNPNFAAAMVELLKSARLSPGDSVGIGWTCSFPALNIATLAAVEMLGLHPIITTSVASSAWGANDPKLTWLDMETALKKGGVFQSSSLSASIGGIGDNGGGLSPEGRRLAREAIERNGVDLIEEETLERSIERRLAIYGHGGEIGAYVNIGQGEASSGGAEITGLLESGLLQSIDLLNLPRRGVLVEMAERKVPIIHCSDVLALAQEFDLPVPPFSYPSVGEGSLFVVERYSTLRAVAFVLILIIVLFVFLRIDLSHYLSARRRR